MAQRIQVRPDDSLTPQKLRPQASPDGRVITERTHVIDTFVGPTAKKNPYAGSQLAELAQSLSGIAPSLQRFAVQHADDHNEAQLKEGMAQAAKVREAGLSFKQAVDNGMIRASDSPFFRAGVREQLGEATAHDLATAWKLHVDGDQELQQSTDTHTYDAKLARFREEWMSQNVGAGNRDQYFDGAFNRVSQNAIDNHRSQFADQAGARLEQQGAQAHFTNTKSALRADLDNGVKPQDISKALTQRLQDLRLQGNGSLMLAQQTGQAVLSLADDMIHEGHGDAAMELVDVVKDLTVDGKSLKDYDPKLAAGLSDLPQAITRGALAQDKLDDDKRQVAWDDRIEAAQVALTQAFLHNDSSQTTKILASIGDIPKAAQHLESTLSAIRATQENPEGRTKAMRQIWRDPSISVDDVFSMPGLGPNDVSYLVNQVQERDNKAQQISAHMDALQARADAKEDRVERRRTAAAAQTDRVLSHPVFRLEFRTIDRRVSDIMQKLDPAAHADIVEDAEAQASLHWMDYMSTEAGQKADNNTRLKWLKDDVTQIVESHRTAFGQATASKGAPKPDATAKPKAPTKRVLGPADFASYGNSNVITPNAQAQLKAAGIPADKAKIRAFFLEQAKLNQ